MVTGLVKVLVQAEKWDGDRAKMAKLLGVEPTDAAVFEQVPNGIVAGGQAAGLGEWVVRNTESGKVTVLSEKQFQAAVEVVA